VLRTPKDPIDTSYGVLATVQLGIPVRALLNAQISPRVPGIILRRPDLNRPAGQLELPEFIQSNRPGRPGLPKDLRELIQRMAAENPSWGQERIADELKLKLGISVSPRTVQKYLTEKAQTFRLNPSAGIDGHHDRASNAMLVTTSEFTSGARSIEQQYVCYLFSRREKLDMQENKQFPRPKNAKNIRRYAQLSSSRRP